MISVDPVSDRAVGNCNTTPKVGDILTATVTGAAAASYEWTLNGKGAVTTETYEVPADAKSGDKIKLVVTAEDGETAEDTVYVGGFTILKLEPTTYADHLTGYKYIRAYFSNSLATLDPDDIEIRSKDTEQLYSIDTVKLSSDGTYADITLFGSVSEGNTHFLDGATIYVMTIDNGEVADSFEFELPIFRSNILVTKVDTAKGKIFFGGEVGYEVGDVYEGNLGTLVGRSVNVGVNSDNEIEKLSVRNAGVVSGVMKYVNKDGDPDEISEKDYFEDQVTKSKYYMTTSPTTTINESTAILVVTGEDWSDNLDDETYDYAKLVLNSNGTVACAVLDPFAWEGGTIKVAEVDGTIVTETSKVNVDLDGYTIEKYGEYVTTADLDEDDIVFYNGNDDAKFAEVYNVVIDGEPSDVDSTSIAIDGISFKWTTDDGSAKYYNTDDDVYEPLDFLGNVEAQKYLNSLDADLGVIAYLDKLGNIAYIDGVVEESAVTTDTWYVTTSAGAGYAQALESYLKFKVSDGTEQTIEIPVSQIKKFNGVKGTMTGEGEDGSDYEFTFVDSDEDPVFEDIEADELIEAGVLVKLTRDEDGEVIGITFGGEYFNDDPDVYPTVTKIDGKDSNALKPGVEKVETNDGTTAKLTDDTVIWVYTTEDDKTTVTRETFANYTKTTEKVSVLNEAGVGPFVLVKGSSVTDVLLRETIIDGESDTFVAGATSTVEGIVTGYSEKKKSGDDENYVYSVTIINKDGDKIPYDTLNENLTADDINNDTYILLTLDKTTEDISEITENAWTRVSALAENKFGCSSTQITTIDGDVIKLDSSALVLKKSGSTYSKIKLNQIAASDKAMIVSWHNEYYNSDDDENYADFLVVEELPSSLTTRTLKPTVTVIGGAWELPDADGEGTFTATLILLDDNGDEVAPEELRVGTAGVAYDVEVDSEATFTISAPSFTGGVFTATLTGDEIDPENNQDGEVIIPVTFSGNEYVLTVTIGNDGTVTAETAPSM